MPQRKPLIGITGDYVRIRDVMPASAAYEVYTRAVNHGAGGLPWIIPPLGAELDLDAVVDRLDGIVFTGARSNVQPHHYDGGPAPENNPEDPARDSTTLPLIPKVLEKGVPMLCICRGMQELNVALGGTLHQEIHKVADRKDHRAGDHLTPDEKFAPAHHVRIEPGGLLSRLAPGGEFQVNSVHGQGIDRLSKRLHVEARADDGVIEAVSVDGSRNFALGVQWHPEWDFLKHPLYHAIWEGFGAACRKYGAR
ncbi:MAG: gamma-glutamyl-gamma-aminobutyrate hydrolase family protein [Gammaproteobacteria bacterium]|nr:gamma-glutamyl-gamma-aminobutyrate hydrolase family protein [Gammaproteobacteria bacterium]